MRGSTIGSRRRRALLFAVTLTPLLSACGSGTPAADGVASSAPGTTTDSPPVQTGAPTSTTGARRDSDRESLEREAAAPRPTSFVESTTVRIPDSVVRLRATAHRGVPFVVAAHSDGSLTAGRLDAAVLTTLASTASEWIAIGDGPSGPVVAAWVEPEGAVSWQFDMATGVWNEHAISEQLLPTDVVALDGQIWVGGIREVPLDLGGISSIPGVVRSSDGVAWEPVETSWAPAIDEATLPTLEVGSFVSVGGDLVATLVPYDPSGQPVVVRSSDGARTWEVVGSGTGATPSLLGSAEPLIGFDARSHGDPTSLAVVRLDEDGAWVPIDLGMPPESSTWRASASSGGGPPIALVNSTWPNDSCRRPTGETSCGAGGGIWFATGFAQGAAYEVDLFDPANSFEPLVVVSTPDRVHAVRAELDRLVVETHDAMLLEPAHPVLGRNGTYEIEPGEVARYSLDVHCGVRSIDGLNEQTWLATEVATDFSDSDLEHAGTVWGELELVEPGRLEFWHPRLAATFQPTADDVDGCE